jgi:hypothetical protein
MSQTGKVDATPAFGLPSIDAAAWVSRRCWNPARPVVDPRQARIHPTKASWRLASWPARAKLPQSCNPSTTQVNMKQSGFTLLTFPPNTLTLSSTLTVPLAYPHGSRSSSA